ncbi:hypothetical protein BH10BAC1_BH10BAC1_01560 [soil metagenome]
MKFRVFLLSLIMASCTSRQKDIDENVNIEQVTEKNGIYYSVDHEGNMTIYSGTDTTYYNENFKIKIMKATYTFEDGLPEGHWEQMDNNGKKLLDIYYKNGEVIKKEN